MELLTLAEARSLMMALRGRISAHYKLRLERQRTWYSVHPEVGSRIEQISEILGELGEGFSERNLTTREESLLAAMNLLDHELSGLPKCPDGLTASEERELRAAMSQAEKLRRRLPASERKSN
jgi:hypothetical protein